MVLLGNIYLFVSSRSIDPPVRIHPAQRAECQTFSPFPPVRRPTCICCAHTWQSSQTGNDHTKCQGDTGTVTSVFMRIGLLKEAEVCASESYSECVLPSEPTLYTIYILHYAHISLSLLINSRSHSNF